MTPLIIAKVAILLALTLLILPVFRKTSASLRYVVLLAGLTTALMLPAIDSLVPEWQVLPQQAASLTTDEAEPTIPMPVIEPVVTRAVADASLRPVLAATLPPERSLELAAVARAIWLAGAAVLVLLLIVRVARLSLSVHRAPTLQDDRWQGLLNDSRQALGLRRRISLRLRPAGSMPAVWGIVRPCVLLPEDCERWPAERRQAVLLHELAHIARQDVAVSLLINAACALHWFNPLVWVLKRKLEEEREQACDDMALENGLSRKLYATQLLATATDCQRRYSLAPVMAGHTQLESRIMAILDNTRTRSVARPSIQAFTTLLMISAMLALSSLSFADAGQSWLDNVRNGDTNPNFVVFAEELASQGIENGDTDALISALATGESMTRAAAAWALGNDEDPRALDALLQAGNDGDAFVRQWAVRSLAYGNDPRILQLFILRMQDSDAETRQWAVRGMKVFSDADTTQPLLAALADSDAEVREWAVRVLATSNDETVIEAIAALLQVETNADVAEWAVRSLAGSDSPIAQSALIAALQSPTADVREWAVRSLGSSADPSVNGAMASLLLVETNADVAEWAVRSLAGRNGDVAQSALVSALQSPATDVREWAARGLAGNTDPNAVQALIGALGDSTADVREWSVRSLGVCGNDAALGPLENLRNDPSDEVREWADRSIRAIRCSS
ncbi:MAG: HEAT repeat domain-containing protein [Pseudomonadota bacterium]